MSVTASTFTKAAAPKSSDIIATKIFIDSVPEYYQLQTCAEPQVSAIVRAMASGCGDNSRMTSYACFCYSSSSKYDYLISAQVSTACNDQAQASSAQDVFGKYCQMGATRGITPAAATGMTTFAAAQSTSNSPLSSITSSAASNRSSTGIRSSSFPASIESFIPSASSTPTTMSSSTRTTTIAAAVTVPAVVLALILGMFLAYRQQYRNRLPFELADDKMGELADERREELPTGPPLVKYRHDTAELSTQSGYAELPIQQQRSYVELPIHNDRSGCPKVDGPWL